MQRVIDETNRRREIQRQYNEEHGITPSTVYKSVEDVMYSTRVADEKAVKWEKKTKIHLSGEDMAREEILEFLEKEMRIAAANLRFERAAEIRDEIESLRNGK
jgi:excinuclease ABC subunit B